MHENQTLTKCTDWKIKLQVVWSGSAMLICLRTAEYGDKSTTIVAPNGPLLSQLIHPSYHTCKHTAAINHWWGGWKETRENSPLAYSWLSIVCILLYKQSHEIFFVPFGLIVRRTYLHTMLLKSAWIVHTVDVRR